MQKEIYAIYDVKAETYSQPIFMVNEKVLLRDCYTMLRQDTAYAAHPEDYSIYHLGLYEDTSGQIDLNSEPKFLYKFIELKNQLEASTNEA